MADSESDEEIDVLSNTDQNGFTMYSGTQYAAIHSQTPHSFGHVGGWQQGKGNPALNSRYFKLKDGHL